MPKGWQVGGTAYYSETAFEPSHSRSDVPAAPRIGRENFAQNKRIYLRSRLPAMFRLE